MFNDIQTVKVNDGFVEVHTGAEDECYLVLSFPSENPQGDLVTLTNIIEMARRSGFRQAQDQWAEAGFHRTAR